MDEAVPAGQQLRPLDEEEAVARRDVEVVVARDRQRVDDADRQRGQRDQRQPRAEAQACSTFSGTSISRLRILPVGPLGSSSTNQILRGYL